MLKFEISSIFSFDSIFEFWDSLFISDNTSNKNSFDHQIHIYLFSLVSVSESFNIELMFPFHKFLEFNNLISRYTHSNSQALL